MIKLMQHEYEGGVSGQPIDPRSLIMADSQPRIGWSIYRDEEREGHVSYLCDTREDTLNLPTTAAPGSEAKIIATGEKLILNHQGKWIVQPSEGGGNSGGGSGGVLVVNITESLDGSKADKSVDEIMSAVNSGKIVIGIQKTEFPSVAFYVYYLIEIRVNKEGNTCVYKDLGNNSGTSLLVQNGTDIVRPELDG